MSRLPDFSSVPFGAGDRTAADDKTWRDAF